MRKFFQAEKRGWASLLILFIGFWTYFFQYNTPAAQFWDENYHIASAQKYIDGVFFFEPHPPLGKLLIAAGEKILSPNRDINTSAFTHTDYIKTFPKGYSFSGMRLFPALAGWFNALLLFWLIQLLFDRVFLSIFGSWLYLFDNALIVHSRAAMLESIQIFFILLTFIVFVLAWRRKKVKSRDYLLVGFMTALAIMVKLNSAILLLLLPLLWYREICFQKLKQPALLMGKTILYLIAAALTIWVVFAIHFALTPKIVPGKTYHAPASVLQSVKSGTILQPGHLLEGIEAYFAYSRQYEKGVPKYNPCKKGENGSLAITWPLMDKTINYRWNKHPDGKVQYLYLVGNPVVWLLVLLGVFFGIVLSAGKVFYHLPLENRKAFTWVFVFTTFYISYMIAVIQIDRVMYLYHYFIPLIFGMILVTALLEYSYGKLLDRGDRVVYTAMFLLMFLIFAVYLWFMPLTYYIPLSTEAFNQRNWFDFWHLQPIR